MRSTKVRIRRLEEVQPKGCDTCRAWSTNTLEILIADDAGFETRMDPKRLDACPDCGRWAPPGERRTIVFDCRADGPQ